MTGSKALERADSNVSASPDGSDGWTTVRRKRGGKSQAEGQSERLVGGDQTREWSGSTHQRTETEVQPVEPLNVTQKAPSPGSTPTKRHPSRRQRRQRLRQNQKETRGDQKIPAQRTADTPVDVPPAPAVETLPPRRWEQVNLRTDSAGGNPSGALPTGPAGCNTASPPGDQPGSDLYWQPVRARESGRQEPQFSSRHRVYTYPPVQDGV